jgi:hypothetical protein
MTLHIEGYQLANDENYFTPDPEEYEQTIDILRGAVRTLELENEALLRECWHFRKKINKLAWLVVIGWLGFFGVILFF